MNVTVIFTYEVSLNDWEKTGIIDKELKLYRELVNKYNHSFTFITFGDEKDDQLKEDNFKIVPIYSFIKKSNSKYVRFLKSFLIPFVLKKHFKESAIIKTNQLHGSWIAIIAKLIYKKKLIIRTGYDPIEFSKLNNKSWLIIFFYRIQKILSLFFSDLYLVSNVLDMNRVTFLKRKVLIRKNWVDKISTNEFFESRNNNTLLSIGRLEQQKNYLGMLENLSGKYELLIYGTGSLEKDILKKSEQKKVPTKIFHNISNELLFQVLEKHVFYINYSKFEGSSKSLLEALAAGCIVLALNNPNNKEIIKNGENGYLIDESTNIDEFITNLKKNQEELIKISQNAIKYITEHHLLKNILINENKNYTDLAK